MKLMQCSACGGKVASQVAAQSARCLFCGQQTEELRVSEDELPSPKKCLQWVVQRQEAERQFRTWAKASWWRPKDLREAKIEVRELYIPAWRVHTRVRSHWTGLETAMTASGKRPGAGVDQREVLHLVAASGGLSPQELYALRPFAAEKVQPWDAQESPIPFEPPVLTQGRARVQAREEINELQQARIAQEQGLINCRSTTVLEEPSFELDMLPVYIGVFRYRQKPWRFLVNAQTGEVVGKAPVDRLKVFLVVVMAMVLLGVLGVVASGGL